MKDYPTKHIIINGDSRNMNLIPDKSVRLIITSPPLRQRHHFIGGEKFKPQLYRLRDKPKLYRSMRRKNRLSAIRNVEYILCSRTR